jgi:hypothetical protein
MSREAPMPPALHFRIQPADRRALERIAAKDGRTVSSLVRKIVGDWLKRSEPALPGNKSQ